MTDKTTTAAVLLVAAIAAVVSYMHVATLALRYGQPPLAAYLLPLSIDGMVATCSTVMLRAAQARLATPWQARAGLVLAVAATLAANVASGAAHGWPGALVAGWPAVAFVVSAETAITMSRRHRVKTAAKQPASERPTVAKSGATRPTATDTEAAVLAALSAKPAMSDGELAAAIGKSQRTARRYRTRLRGTGTVGKMPALADEAA
jgi:hypothetical protein